MHKSALPKSHDRLQPVQVLSIDLTDLINDKEDEDEINKFPSCAMIEKPKLSILSTCFGLRLFQKDHALSSKLKMVHNAFLQEMNDDYELDFLHKLKLATDDEFFYIAGRHLAWKLKSDGSLLNQLSVVDDGIDSSPLSFVCDGEWIAISHQMTEVRSLGDSDEAQIIVEHGLITLMKCDDFDSPLQLHLDHADHLNPILLSPLCFMGGPPDQRHMFLLKQYSFWNQTEGVSMGIRIANFDETPVEELHEVKTNLMRKDIVRAKARRSEQCATMFPSHFRDFQRLHRSSPFFYPPFGEHSTQLENPGVKMIVADDPSNPQNEYFRNSLVQIHTSRVAWDAASAAHNAGESPDNVSGWEVCALLMDDDDDDDDDGGSSSLQIRSRINVNRQGGAAAVCECSLSDYKLNDVPVALCGCSFDDQFCLCSLNDENTFLFERVVWGVRSKSAAQFAYFKTAQGAHRRPKAGSRKKIKHSEHGSRSKSMKSMKSRKSRNL